MNRHIKGVLAIVTFPIWLPVVLVRCTLDMVREEFDGAWGEACELGDDLLKMLRRGER